MEAAEPRAQLAVEKVLLQSESWKGLLQWAQWHGQKVRALGHVGFSSLQNPTVISRWAGRGCREMLSYFIYDLLEKWLD